MTFITIIFLLVMHGYVPTGQQYLSMSETYSRTGIIPNACFVKDDPRFPKEYTYCAAQPEERTVPLEIKKRSWKFEDGQ